MHNVTREHSAILSTFIELQVVVKTFVLSIFTVLCLIPSCDLIDCIWSVSLTLFGMVMFTFLRPCDTQYPIIK